MAVFWKVIITVFLLCTIVVDGNRLRRRRRQAMLNSPPDNSFNQQQLSANAQDQPMQQQGGQNEIVVGKNSFGAAGRPGRQYYPYQGQTGYGTIQSLNYPYAGAGVGAYQYGYGQYGQYGQGQGLGQYGAYYNQNPGSSGFYPGYNSVGSYSNPSYSSNYYPSSGMNYGSYFWNAAQKQNINIFTVFLSSLLALVIGLIAV